MTLQVVSSTQSLQQTGALAILPVTAMVSNMV